MNVKHTEKDIQPTSQEEALAERLCQEHARRSRDRDREWSGSLDVTWHERQGWYYVARLVLKSHTPNGKDDRT